VCLDAFDLYTLRSVGLHSVPEITNGKSDAHEELNDLMLNMKEIDRLYYDHIRECPNCRQILGLAMKLWNDHSTPED
jgi:hypothetical protein